MTRADNHPPGGGATVFAPLIEHVSPVDRIGIVGIGGLGHLAITFAAKMGCDVVVFSGTESKREEAMKLGATEFYATKGVEDYSTLGLKKPLNHLLLTTSVAPERMEVYYPILDQRAKIFPLTVDFGTLQTAYGPTIFRGMQIIGSKLASRYVQCVAFPIKTDLTFEGSRINLVRRCLSLPPATRWSPSSRSSP